MKGKWGIIALLGGIGILAIILLIVFGDNNTSKSVKEEAENNQPVNWEISYDITDRSPYGTFLFYELLKKKYSEEKKKIKVIDDDFRKELNDTVNKKPEIYFLISNSMKLNKDEKIALKSFVENGNYAFISIEEFPETFKEIINETHFIETTRMERTKINFYPSSLRNKKSYYEFFYIYENEKNSWPWKSFKSKTNYPDEDYYIETGEKEYDYDSDPGIYEEDLHHNNIVPGEMDSLYSNYLSYEHNTDSNDVFIRVNYGEGAFYFHSIPISFTNLSLLKEKNVEHMERVLSCLPDAQPVWDKYGQMDFTLYMEKFGNSPDSGSGFDRPRNSPLQFILSKQSLKWAYYVLLGTLLFYILFQMKRKQKIIPAVAKNENSSLDFIDTVSKLYLQQYKHKNILRHKYRILLNFIRERYYLSAAKPDQQYISMLSKKSQLEEDRISRLFATFESIEKSTNVSDEMLITVHQQVEYFYKNCK